jgi:hypothetical protein
MWGRLPTSLLRMWDRLMWRRLPTSLLRHTLRGQTEAPFLLSAYSVPIAIGSDSL